MRMLYVVHIVAGSLSLVFGYVALFAAKGATVHRRSGTVFVYAMLTIADQGVRVVESVPSQPCCDGTLSTTLTP